MKFPSKFSSISSSRRGGQNTHFAFSNSSIIFSASGMLLSSSPLWRRLMIEGIENWRLLSSIPALLKRSISSPCPNSSSIPNTRTQRFSEPRRMSDLIGNFHDRYVILGSTSASNLSRFSSIHFSIKSTWTIYPLQIQGNGSVGWHWHATSRLHSSLSRVVKSLTTSPLFSLFAPAIVTWSQTESPRPRAYGVGGGVQRSTWRGRHKGPTIVGVVKMSKRVDVYVEGLG